MTAADTIASLARAIENASAAGEWEVVRRLVGLLEGHSSPPVRLQAAVEAPSLLPAPNDTPSPRVPSDVAADPLDDPELWDQTPPFMPKVKTDNPPLWERYSERRLRRMREVLKSGGITALEAAEDEFGGWYLADLATLRELGVSKDESLRLVFG